MRFAHVLHQNKILLVIILLALLLRIGLFFFVISDENRYMTGDAHAYNRLAMNVLGYRVFSSSEQSPLVPHVQYPPFYPLYLSLVYWLSDYNIAFALFLQVIMGVLTVLFTYKLAIKLFDKKVALISSFLLAIDSVSVTYNNRILTESIFPFLLILGLYCFIIFLNEEKIRYLMLSGLFLSLCALTRPISLYLPIMLVPFIICV